MASSPAVKAGYYNSGALDNFPPLAINTSLLTHVLYAFLVPNNVTFEFDISNSEAASLSNFTTTLHHKKPQVKALYSIGGGGIDPNPFAAMASKASSRRTLIHATTEVTRKYGFDGLTLIGSIPKAQEKWMILPTYQKNGGMQSKRRLGTQIGLPY
jgi:chitinase